MDYNEALEKTVGFDVKTFARKAVEGGYPEEKTYKDPAFINVILLDISAWLAVGKAEGWIDEKYPNGEMLCENHGGFCTQRYCQYGGFVDPKEKHLQFITNLW